MKASDCELNFHFRNSQVWSQLPSVPFSRKHCQAGLVTYPNGDKGILVGGGDLGQRSVEFLNLDTLIWEPKQSLPYDIGFGASVPFQNSFLIVGGDAQFRGYLDTVFYYNPDLDEWELIKTMDYTRRVFAGFMVPDLYANCY